MSTQQLWNGDWHGKSNFINHKSHIKSSEIEAETPCWKLGN